MVCRFLPFFSAMELFLCVIPRSSLEHIGGYKFSFVSGKQQRIYADNALSPPSAWLFFCSKFVIESSLLMQFFSLLGWIHIVYIV